MSTSSRRKSSRRDIYDDDDVPVQTPRSPAADFAPSLTAEPSEISGTYYTARDGDEKGHTSRSERVRKSNRTSRHSAQAEGDDASTSRNDSERSRRDSRKSSQPGGMNSARAYKGNEASLPQNQFPGEFPETYSKPYRPSGLASDYYGDNGESVSSQPGVRPNQPSIVTSAEQAHLIEPSIEAKPPPEPSSMGQTGAAASYFGTTSLDGGSGMQSTPSKPPRNPSLRPNKPPKHSQTGTSPRASPDPQGPPSAGALSMGLAADYYFGAGGETAGPGYQTPSRPSAQATSASFSAPVDFGGPQNHSSAAMYGGAALAGAAAGTYISSHAHDGGWSSQPHASAMDGPQASSHGRPPSQFAPTQHVHRHQRRGPLGKFVDWFRDPDAVAEYEQYTEAIGVCKYCFDPMSSPADAPRRHHFHAKRRSSGSRYGSTTRVDKTYRYSSDEDKRRRSGARKTVIGGLTGYGAAKIGEALYKNKYDFDDTYSVKSGQPANQNRVTFQDGASSYQRKSRRYPSTEDVRLQGPNTSRRKSNGNGHTGKGNTRRRDSSSSSSSHGISKGAAISTAAGAAGLAMGAASVEDKLRRRRSRSPSSKKRYYSRRVSPMHSYVDLSATNEKSGGLVGFFTSPSANKRKGRKAKGFFNFGNASSSSSDADLAFGAATVRRKASQKRLKESHGKRGRHDSNGGMMGLVAAGEALAAESVRREKRGKKMDDADEMTGRYSSRSYRQRYSTDDHHDSAEGNDGEWYDTDDNDSQSSSSVDTALAYGGGISALQSRESLVQDRRTSAQTHERRSSDRFSTRDERKSRYDDSLRHSEALGSAAFQAGATAAAVGVVGALAASNASPFGRSPSSIHDDLPPMREVEPRPVSDHDFNVSRNGSRRNEAGETYGVAQPRKFSATSVPLQQPQPIVAVAPFLQGTALGMTRREEGVPSYDIPPVSVGDRASSQRMAMEYSGNVRRTRRDSSPAKLTSHDQKNNVSLSLTEDQVDNEQRDGETGSKRKSRRSDKDQRKSSESVSTKIKSVDGPETQWTGAEVDGRRPSEARRISLDSSDERVAEIERELQRLYAEQRKFEERERKQKDKPSDQVIATAAVVAAAATATAVVVAKSKRSSSPEEDGTPRLRSSLKKTKERKISPPAESQQERIARMAAQRVGSTSSPVHEDYSTFFVPKELQDHLKEHNAKAEHRDDIGANVLEIIPGAARSRPQHPFDPFTYRHFGLELEDDPTLHPWAVPLLELVEPTPPGSQAHSVQGDTSPMSAPKSLETSVDEAKDIGEPLERKANTGSKVTWGDHDTYVYEVQTPEYERANYMHEAELAEATHSKTQSSDDYKDEATQPHGRPVVHRVWTLDEGEAEKLEKEVPVVDDRPQMSRTWTVDDAEAGQIEHEIPSGLPSDAGRRSVQPSTVFEEQTPPTSHDLAALDSQEQPRAVYQSPFAETVSDLAVHHEMDEQTRDTSRSALRANGEEVKDDEEPTDSKPFESSPAVRVSKSERRRLERASSSSEVPKTFGDFSVPEALPREDETASTKQIPEDDSVFDYMVDSNGDSVPSASMLGMGTAAVLSSSLLARDEGEDDASVPMAAEADVGSVGKLRRSTTFDEPVSPRSASAAHYQSDPEEWERSGAKKSRKSKRSSKNDIGSEDRKMSRSDRQASIPDPDPEAERPRRSRTEDDISDLQDVSEDKKSKRKSRRKSAGFDEAKDVGASKSRLEDEAARPRRHRERDSGLFDDDDLRSTVSSPTHSEKKSDKKSGSFFGSIFSSNKSDVSTSSRKNSKSSKADDQAEQERDDRRESRRKRSSKGKDFDDAASVASESSRKSRRDSVSRNIDQPLNPRDQSIDDGFVSAEDGAEDDETFLGKRPEMPPPTVMGMPMVTDGVSGPAPENRTSNEPKIDIGVPADSVGTVEAEAESFQQATQPVTPRFASSQRLSAVRTSDLPSSPTNTSSPTAVPLHFRRPPASPTDGRFTMSSPIASPSSPLTTPRTRQGRPKSTEFRSSKEFRPLYLVEVQNARIATPEPTENYPSLPSSRTSSANASTEDLRAGAQAQEPEAFTPSRLSAQMFRERGRRHSYSYWHDETRRESPDYLDSRSATPVPGDAQRARESEKKPRPKYEFHSPSELLQDPKQHQDTALFDESETPASPLPSVVSTEADQDYMSARSRSLSPTRARSLSRGRSTSTSRSTSAAWQDALTTTAAGALAGSVLGVAADEILQNSEDVSPSTDDHSMAHGTEPTTSEALKPAATTMDSSNLDTEEKTADLEKLQAAAATDTVARSETVPTVPFGGDGGLVRSPAPGHLDDGPSGEVLPRRPYDTVEQHVIDEDVPLVDEVFQTPQTDAGLAKPELSPFEQAFEAAVNVRGLSEGATVRDAVQAFQPEFNEQQEPTGNSLATIEEGSEMPALAVEPQPDIAQPGRKPSKKEKRKAKKSSRKSSDYVDWPAKSSAQQMEILQSEQQAVVPTERAGLDIQYPEIQPQSGEQPRNPSGDHFEVPQERLDNSNLETPMGIHIPEAATSAEQEEETLQSKSAAAPEAPTNGNEWLLETKKGKDAKKDKKSKKKQAFSWDDEPSGEMPTDQFQPIQDSMNTDSQQTVVAGKDDAPAGAAMNKLADTTTESSHKTSTMQEPRSSESAQNNSDDIWEMSTKKNKKKSKKKSLAWADEEAELMTSKEPQIVAPRESPEAARTVPEEDYPRSEGTVFEASMVEDPAALEVDKLQDVSDIPEQLSLPTTLEDMSFPPKEATNENAAVDEISQHRLDEQHDETNWAFTSKPSKKTSKKDKKKRASAIAAAAGTTGTLLAADGLDRDTSSFEAAQDYADTNQSVEGEDVKEVQAGSSAGTATYAMTAGNIIDGAKAAPGSTTSRDNIATSVSPDRLEDVSATKDIPSSVPNDPHVLPTAPVVTLDQPAEDLVRVDDRVQETISDPAPAGESRPDSDLFTVPANKPKKDKNKKRASTLEDVESTPSVLETSAAARDLSEAVVSEDTGAEDKIISPTVSSLPREAEEDLFLIKATKSKKDKKGKKKRLTLNDDFEAKQQDTVSEKTTETPEAISTSLVTATTLPEERSVAGNPSQEPEPISRTQQRDGQESGADPEFPLIVTKKSKKDKRKKRQSTLDWESVEAATSSAVEDTEEGLPPNDQNAEERPDKLSRDIEQDSKEEIEQSTDIVLPDTEDRAVPDEEWSLTPKKGKKEKKKKRQSTLEPTSLEIETPLPLAGDTTGSDKAIENGEAFGAAEAGRPDERTAAGDENGIEGDAQLAPVDEQNDMWAFTTKKSKKDKKSKRKSGLTMMTPDVEEQTIDSQHDQAIQAPENEMSANETQEAFSRTTGLAGPEESDDTWAITTKKSKDKKKTRKSSLDTVDIFPVEEQHLRGEADKEIIPQGAEKSVPDEASILPGAWPTIAPAEESPAYGAPMLVDESVPREESMLVERHLISHATAGVNAPRGKEVWLEPRMERSSSTAKPDEPTAGDPASSELHESIRTTFPPVYDASETVQNVTVPSQVDDLFDKHAESSVVQQDVETVQKEHEGADVEEWATQVKKSKQDKGKKHQTIFDDVPTEPVQLVGESSHELPKSLDQPVDTDKLNQPFQTVEPGQNSDQAAGEAAPEEEWGISKKSKKEKKKKKRQSMFDDAFAEEATITETEPTSNKHAPIVPNEDSANSALPAVIDTETKDLIPEQAIADEWTLSKPSKKGKKKKRQFAFNDNLPEGEASPLEAAPEPTQELAASQPESCDPADAAPVVVEEPLSHRLFEPSNEDDLSRSKASEKDRLKKARHEDAVEASGTMLEQPRLYTAAGVPKELEISENIWPTQPIPADDAFSASKDEETIPSSPSAVADIEKHPNVVASTKHERLVEDVNLTMDNPFLTYEHDMNGDRREQKVLASNDAAESQSLRTPGDAIPTSDPLAEVANISQPPQAFEVAEAREQQPDITASEAPIPADQSGASDEPFEQEWSFSTKKSKKDKKKKRPLTLDIAELREPPQETSLVPDTEVEYREASTPAAGSTPHPAPADSAEVPAPEANVEDEWSGSARKTKKDRKKQRKSTTQIAWEEPELQETVPSTTLGRGGSIDHFEPAIGRDGQEAMATRLASDHELVPLSDQDNSHEVPEQRLAITNLGTQPETPAFGDVDSKQEPIFDTMNGPLEEKKAVEAPREDADAEDTALPADPEPSLTAARAIGPEDDWGFQTKKSKKKSRKNRASLAENGPETPEAEVPKLVEQTENATLGPRTASPDLMEGVETEQQTPQAPAETAAEEYFVPINRKKSKKDKKKKSLPAWTEPPQQRDDRSVENLVPGHTQEEGTRQLQGVQEPQWDTVSQQILDSTAPADGVYDAFTTPMKQHDILGPGESVSNREAKKERRQFEYNGTEALLSGKERRQFEFNGNEETQRRPGTPETPRLSEDAMDRSIPEDLMDNHGRQAQSPRISRPQEDEDLMSDVSASTRERRKRRRSPPAWSGEEPDDLPTSRALTPPPEHDDIMDTALVVAAGLGIGSAEREPTQENPTKPPSPARQPSAGWSFAQLGAAYDNRDSGIQLESPMLAQGQISSTRDSGFVQGPLDGPRQVDTAMDVSLRPPRPQSPTSSTEDVSQTGTRRIHRGEKGVLETPRRKPSPVESTSKDRSSVLFSSPAMPTPLDAKARERSPVHASSPLRRSPSIHGHHLNREELRQKATSAHALEPSDHLASNVIDRSAAAEVTLAPLDATRDQPFSPRSSLNTIREENVEANSQSGKPHPFAGSHVSLLPHEYPEQPDFDGTVALVAAGTAGLAAAALSRPPRDLGPAKSLGTSKSRTSSLRNLRSNSDQQYRSVYSPPPNLVHEQELDRSATRDRDMADIYDGYGSYPGSPKSPTRPPSVRRRQSMQQIKDLESRLDQLASENRALVEAKMMVEQSLEHANFERNRAENSIDSLKNTTVQVQERDAEIARLKQEIASLTATHETLKREHEHNLTHLHQEHEHAHSQWQESSRELETLRSRHAELSSGMESIVRHEIDTALAEKDGEVLRLRDDLEEARQKIRQLQSEILKRGADDVVAFHDEDYFDAACQKLCQQVQGWVLRFSKYNDLKLCRATNEVRDEKIVDRFDNAILDGSDVDTYLADRVTRRDVFMSVVMTMIWEYVFTRYLFGMDREQRQKLKQLEKNLGEVGPASAVHQWRALTLTLLSKRESFKAQRESDTEAVAIEIFNTLSRFLPPPQNLEQPIIGSLRNVMHTAVELSIEMRTQRAEYIMLPPLQPEYDTNGDLARKVYFNASLMNERSGETTSNDELERNQAVVRMVLFPLVVKKGDDNGVGDDEIVVCPAQVLIAGPDKGKKSRGAMRATSGGSHSDRMNVDARSLRAVSTHSLGAMSGIDANDNMF
ncbi:hypothetical protein LTR20_000884 [Exophiala xenobiotica]|nr:hypothetical protein LTS13_005162 [Exophiala xenobiotica]KAK5396744.1 hypothetical protein LTR79_005380 [Exophiala xenobiotica]KAK5470623.1 hypothetical protein LTR20_000884 [Exophiala xenobiotica]KAK5502120.1 hypothetical protein LTR83_002214 [Exophiala xenobiotica]KAK5526244.1 hypothetical protein LTR07_000014 [Exophiala xenobiotica]